MSHVFKIKGQEQFPNTVTELELILEHPHIAVVKVNGKPVLEVNAATGDNLVYFRRVYLPETWRANIRTDEHGKIKEY